MKRIFILILLINLFGFIPKAFSDMHWEDCTEGLWGGPIDRMYFLENEVEMYRKASYSSNDSGKSWSPQKYLAPNFKEEKYWYITNIYKYKNRYLMSGSSDIFRVDYISEDKRKLYGTKTYGGPQSAVFMNGFACDSSILFRFYDSTSKKMRTYITQDEPQGNEGNFNIVPIPEENDFNYPDYKYTNFSEEDGKIYATVCTSNLGEGYSDKYFYSTDWGWSWKEVKVSEVFGGVKEVKYINGKYYIITPMTIWRQDDEGKYVLCEDGWSGKMDYLDPILIGYKDKLISSGLETGTHKYVLASSTDGGKTWLRFGTSEFSVKQLLAIGDKIIANTVTFGMMASTDNGQTWVESNKGYYYYPDNFDEPWMKIYVDGNYAYTAPRNYDLRNTIMKSYDGGRSWVRKLVDTSLGYPQDPGPADNNKYTVALTKWGLYAINRSNSSTYRTNDTGETWQLYSKVAIFYDNYNMYERNDTLFYFFSYQGYYNWIYYSLDTGKTQILYDSTYRQKLPDSSQHFILADGVYYALNKEHKFYKSTDEGNHWEFVNQFTLPCADTNTKIFWIDLETEKIKIFLSTIPRYSHGRDSVFMSDNFGKTWKFIPYPSDTLSYGGWADVNGSLYLRSSSPQNRVFKTTDEGTTWEDITFGLEDKQIADFLPAGDYLYVSTYEGLYRIYSPPVSVKESKTEEVLLPIELYPSPAKDIIYVKNDYWGINEVKVYDMLGRECSVGRFNINQFDVSNLQPGVYLAKFIFPGNWSIIKKFVKL